MATLLFILFILMIVAIVGMFLNSISSILGVIFTVCIGIFLFLMLIGSVGMFLSSIVRFFTATPEEKRAHMVNREIRELRRQGRKAEARLIEQNEMLLNKDKK